MGKKRNPWATRTIKWTVVLIVVWTIVALIGRLRGENLHDPFVTVLLLSCLLGGVALAFAVPTMGIMSLSEDSFAGILASAAAVLVAAIAIALSIWYIFPYGLGR